jgi:DNA-directed RNA polymerase specialized sigma subunit
MTQVEIADDVGCSQMQVSRLLRRSLEKLLAAVKGDVWQRTALR